MLVKKLGGALFSSADNIIRAGSIFSAKMNKNQSVIIVSAFGKTTRALDSAINLACEGSLKEALLILDEIMNFHSLFLKYIHNSNDELLMKIQLIFANQKRTLKGVSITKELTKKTRDKFIAVGEQLALLIIFYYSKQFSDASTMLDSSELFITDDNYGNAAPLLPTTLDRIQSTIPALFKLHDFIITQGFVGATTQGCTTTMGIESSNLSAALIAYALDTPELHVITDVEGIKTADPRIFANATHISSLSYSMAEILAQRGLKLIYPQMIPLLKEKGIQAIYYSASNPEGNRTVIGHSSATIQPKVITHSENSIWLSNVFFPEFVSCLNKLSQNTLHKNIKEIHYSDDNSVNIILNHFNDEFYCLLADVLHT